MICDVLASTKVKKLPAMGQMGGIGNLCGELEPWAMLGQQAGVTLACAFAFLSMSSWREAPPAHCLLIHPFTVKFCCVPAQQTL